MRKYLTVSILFSLAIQLATAGDITGKITLKGVRGKQITILYLEKVGGLSKLVSMPLLPQYSRLTGMILYEYNYHLWM